MTEAPFPGGRKVEAEVQPPLPGEAWVQSEDAAEGWGGS